MAKVNLLIDTDILIDYLNRGHYSAILGNREIRVYFSVVTKKELLSKKGLKDSERSAILNVLSKLRIINLDNQIAEEYFKLRTKYPNLGKEDALIAATCLTKSLPLMTMNWKHYKDIEGLVLFRGE